MMLLCGCHLGVTFMEGPQAGELALRQSACSLTTNTRPTATKRSRQYEPKDENGRKESLINFSAALPRRTDDRKAALEVQQLP